jgi:metal-responsive CopG/Arc/MetJ family transcriptional regulator
MKTKTAAPQKANPKPARALKMKTTPVAVRVSDDHLVELDKISKRLGTHRSALVQLAIGEFIERRN